MNFFEILSNYRKRKIISSYASRVNQYFLFSPYNKLTYENFLIKLKNDNKVRIIDFDATLDSKKTNFVFRHDLDMPACLRNFHNLAELHTKHEIPLSIFVRMDDIDYSHKESYSFVCKYLKNFRVGLHSSCYIHADPIEALKEEFRKFQVIYNYSPEFLTLHGLGEYKYKERLKFIDFISKNYKDFSFTFADFIPDLRHYDYVIQDCHLKDERRFLKKDIEILPPYFKRSCYLFLTHPCYWE